MSKFFVSNIQEKVGAVVKHSGQYPLNHSIESVGLSAAVFDKMSQHNGESFVTKNGGGYFVGTPIVAPYINCKNAAKYLYENIREDNISVLRRDIAGFWAALVLKDGKLYILNDYYGIYDVCYTVSGNAYYVGNQLSDVARSKGILELDEFPFIMENFQNGAFPGFTSFKDIFKLTSDNYIVIEHGVLSVKDCVQAPIDCNYVGVKSALEDISALIKEYASAISNKYGKIAIGMTGGLDSRLLFGAFTSVGADVTCFHGVSSDTCREDKAIVEEICASYGMPLELFDWNQPKSFNLLEQEDVWEEIGFNNFIALGCKSHLEQFKEAGKRFPFYQSGYFCEALRLRDWACTRGKAFSLIDYVDNYYIEKNLKKSYDNYEDYRNYLIKGFKKQLKTMGYSGDAQQIPIDFFERFRWILSRFHDSRSTFNMNMYQYTFSLMSVPFIHDYILCLPAKIIKGGSFQIRLLDELDHKLLKFNVFSHRRAYHIKGYKKIPDFTKKNVVDYVFLNLPIIKTAIVKVYQRWKYHTAERRNIMLDDINKLGVKIPPYLNIDTYQGSMARLRAFLIGCRCLQRDFSS